MKKILITGASGFLGRKIIELFSGTDIPILATDLNPVSHFKSEIEYQCLDLVSCDEESLRKLVCGVSTILHVAGFAHHKGAVTPEIQKKYHTINTEVTKKLFRVAEATESVERFVFLSSGSVYGSADFTNVFNEDSECQPDDDYGKSKWEAEKYLLAYEHSKTTPLVLRMATLFGEGDPGNMRRLILSIVRNRFVWIDTGKARKSFIHCDDAARACFLAATEKMKDEKKIYNISGETLETGKILEDIFQELNKRLPTIRIPRALASGLAYVLSACSLHRGPAAKICRSVVKWQDDKPYDGSRFEQDFNFSPSISIREGIRREIAWLRSIGEIK